MESQFFVNNIFYGPPGTGKTYSVVEEALKILGVGEQDIQPYREIDVADLLEAFYSKHTNFLNNSKYKPGKKPYRNLYSLNALMALFMKNNATSLKKQAIIDETGWVGPSSYVQRERALTNFDLSEEDWESDERTALSLNSSGKEILEKYKSTYERAESIPPNDLPNFAVEHLVETIKNTTASSMTLWKNIIICTLRHGYTEGYLFVYKGLEQMSAEEKKNVITEKEKQDLEKYYNYTGDLTFLAWTIAYLQNLDLIEDAEEDDRIKKYSLNQKGMDLIQSLRILEDVAPEDVHESVHVYPEERFYSSEDMLMKLLSKKKQIILYGPPGTGKTFFTQYIAVKCIDPHNIEITDLDVRGQGVVSQEHDFTGIRLRSRSSKKPKTRREAINYLKEGYLIDATREQPYEFRKADIFPFFLDLLTEEPAEYPVNFISFLNCEKQGRGWECLIPGLEQSKKGQVYNHCLDNYEILVLRKENNRIIISIP